MQVIARPSFARFRSGATALGLHALALLRPARS